MQTQFVIDEDSTELLYDNDGEPYHSVSVFIQKTPFEKFTDDAINFLAESITGYVHETVFVRIRNEIRLTFSTIQLSDTQLAILDSLDLKELAILSKNVAGEFHQRDRNSTGVCKIYKDYFSRIAITHYMDSARFDNNVEERQKAILSIFYSELMKFATPHQVEYVYNEMNKKIHQPQYFGFVFNAQGDEKTENAIRYFNTVLELHISCSRYCLQIWPTLFQHEITKAHRNNLTDDVIKKIFGLFNGPETRKFINGFPLVNREIGAACTKEHSEFKSLRR